MAFLPNIIFAKTFVREIGENVFAWDIDELGGQKTDFVSPSFNIRATSTPEEEQSTRLERFHLELSKIDDGLSFEVSLVKETPGEINVKVNDITVELASHNIEGPVYFRIGGAGEQKKRIGQIDYADVPNKTQIRLNVTLLEVAHESANFRF